MTMVIMQQRKS